MKLKTIFTKLKEIKKISKPVINYIHFQPRSHAINLESLPFTSTSLYLYTLGTFLPTKINFIGKGFFYNIFFFNLYVLSSTDKLSAFESFCDTYYCWDFDFETISYFGKFLDVS